ncbi:MAG: tRNA epoxyqueuosine(34) reductase QueG [Calditrichia bacterium]
MNREELALQIKKKALEVGFSAAGITDALIPEKAAAGLNEYIREKRHGTMDWMQRTQAQRSNPAAYFPQVRSIIMTASNYFRSAEEMRFPAECGDISLYARGRDYHKVIRKRLKILLEFITGLEPDTNGRPFVDSFPIMEKPLAQKAGLGWIARNTTLILKGKGSYYFLGGLLLNLELPADQPFTEDYCGSCHACQEACPTNALLHDRQIDSRRCISYLTIEHSGAIEPSLQKKMQNYVFGCDICQIVCPWNRFSTDTAEKDFFSRFKLEDLKLERLLNLSENEFNRLFEGTPVRRSGYQNFLRNAKIARENLNRQGNKTAD